MLNLSKFHDNRGVSLCIILLTDKQTDKTNRTKNITSFGRGKNVTTPANQHTHTHTHTHTQRETEKKKIRKKERKKEGEKCERPSMSQPFLLSSPPQVFWNSARRPVSIIS